ncbi:MAG: hypothetical protein QOH71_242 [Blastocatellia bacterium]|jgi:hypothetical protein|nr:hypothetical protein [Blastocatellia bacterium]
MKRIGIIFVSLLVSSGCVVVAGYSSERGWFVWPGTIVIFIVGVVLLLLFKRRK